MFIINYRCLSENTASQNLLCSKSRHWLKSKEDPLSSEVDFKADVFGGFYILYFKFDNQGEVYYTF